MTELPINVQTLMQLLQLRGAEILRLTEDNAKLRAALERLVMAKNEKDRHGDTPVYQALKKGAWEAARAALTAQPAAPGGE